jgi:hypothetical protein
MAPFEALYGQQCRTPFFWSQIGESQVFGLEVLKDAERQVWMIRENSRLHSFIRRVTPISEEDIYHSKWATSYT